jgi:pyruvate/2-oxoacid:ferredoxin oxidoreductase alpha subunit
VSHLATMEARLPILHFFDGFRTSHEVNKVSKTTLSQTPLNPQHRFRDLRTLGKKYN